MKYKTLFAFIGIIFFIGVFNWNSINTPFERDEGEYAYSAKILLKGGLPYRDSFTLKPPMIIYTYALGQIIDSDAVWPPRVLRLIFIFGIILLTGLIIKKEYGENLGITSMYILVPMLSFPYITSLAANTEIFMLLPLMGVVYLYTYNKENERINFISFFLAGFLGTIAICYKPIAFLPIFFVFLFWIFKVWQKNKKIKDVFGSIIYISFGVIFSLLIILGYFLIKDNGKSLFDNVVIYSFYYINSITSYLPTIFRQLAIFWNKWSILCILLITYPFLKPKNWYFYLGLFFISFLAVLKSNLYHYYILIIPFWAIIISGSIYSISQFFKEKYKNNYILYIITFVILITMFHSVETQFFKNKDEMLIWIYGTQNPFLESKIIAEKISEITKESDKIFIAGSEPQILFYANRKSSSRFIITYPLVIKSPVQTNYKEEAINEIKQNKPEIIVISQREESGFINEENPTNFKNFIYDLLEKEYHLIGGYNTNKNSFLEKESMTEPMTNFSLLLYKKI